MKVEVIVQEEIPFVIGGIYACEHRIGQGWEFLQLIDDGRTHHEYERFALVDAETGVTVTNGWLNEKNIKEILGQHSAIHCPDARLTVTINKRNPRPASSPRVEEKP